MKTVANIIIINSQNVKPEHLLAVIMMSVQKSSVSAWTSSTEVINTELPKLPPDNLKSLRHWLAELHGIQVIAWNISVCSFLNMQLYLMRMHEATIYVTATKGCSVYPFHQQHVHGVTEQQPTIQLYVKSSYSVCVT